MFRTHSVSGYDVVPLNPVTSTHTYVSLFKFYCEIIITTAIRTTRCRCVFTLFLFLFSFFKIIFIIRDIPRRALYYQVSYLSKKTFCFFFFFTTRCFPIHTDTVRRLTSTRSMWVQVCTSIMPVSRLGLLKATKYKRAHS